jgi:hypothetical protein
MNSDYCDRDDFEEFDKISFHVRNEYHLRQMTSILQSSPSLTQIS